MRRAVWVVGRDRKQMLELQRQVNSTGSMKALCMLSMEAVERALCLVKEQPENPMYDPSLILLDYDVEKGEGFRTTALLADSERIAGVPVFYSVGRGQEQAETECYERGAAMVVCKPFSALEISRIEHIAWQYEKSRNYEKLLQSQASNLQAAREILNLNRQLQMRNELLYQVFGKYFSDEVLHKILEHPELASIGGEKREVTILMSDLRGFTSTCEDMEPEEVTELLNYYFGRMAQLISEYHGTVIEYLGDGILAVFGAVMDSGQHTADAIAAGIAMQNAMKEIHGFCEEKGYPVLEMGIGIHRGMVFIGNVGSEKLMRYNVIGKAVNECSRIENCSVGGQILVSEETIRKAGCPIAVEEEFEVRVKGLRHPVMVCEVRGMGGSYGLSLVETDMEELRVVGIPVFFCIHIIEGKLVKKQAFRTRLKKLSDKRAVVEQTEAVIPLYADVEIEIEEPDRQVFRGVYAKVVANRGTDVCLHFTHANRRFREFSERMISEVEHYIIDGRTGGNGKRKLSGEAEGGYDRMAQRYGFEDTRIVGRIHQGESMFYSREDSFGIIPLTGESDPAGTEDPVLYRQLAEDQNCRYLLLVSLGKGEFRLQAVSRSPEVRAVEFLDSFLGDYGLVRGGADYAEARIPEAILRVMMTGQGISEPMEFFFHCTRDYFEQCECIDASAGNTEGIPGRDKMRHYRKKRRPWAYVRSCDVVPEGEQFRIRSLENESGLIFAASPELYVMVGCRGEIYHIERSKFESTYEATSEPFDVFTQMTEFLPEVETIPDHRFISLDELAVLCYPKTSGGIYARQLERRAKVFPVGGDGEYYLGHPGDYLVVRADDPCDCYIVRKDVFLETYEEALDL